jgi:hypothetical protein
MDPFGQPFAAELARLSDGRLGKSETEILSRMGRPEVVRVVSGQLSWLGPESVELLSTRGPEEFARALVREQVREAGDPVEPLDRFAWLGGLFYALNFLEP